MIDEFLKEEQHLTAGTSYMPLFRNANVLPLLSVPDVARFLRVERTHVVCQNVPTGMLK